MFGQNHLYVKMLFYKGFRYSEDSRFPVSRPDDCTILSGRSSVHCSIRPEDLSYHPDARQIKHHLSGRRVSPSRPFIVSRSFCSSLHPSGPLSSPSGAIKYSIKLPILSKIIYGKIASTVRTTWLSIQTCFSLRQESQFKFNCPDVCQQGPKARSTDMEIADSTSNCPDAYLSWSGRAHHRYGNCVLKINCPDGHPPWSGRSKPYMEILAADVRPSRRQCLTVRTQLSNRKDFQQKSHKFWSHSCPSGQPMSTVRTAPIYFTTGAHIFYSSRPFEPQPINRGPWALRTARIRY
jgi:hypothetical protein